MSKLRAFRRALRASVGKVCAYQIGDGFGATIAPVLERVIRGERIHDAEVFGALADDDMAAEHWELVAEKLAAPMIIPAGKGGKATALISVRGVMLYDVEFQPFATSSLLLAQTMTALANDPEIGTIVLDIDSPGGVVTGVPEAADAVFAARTGAKVVALVNPLAASAAYYIASQAAEIVAVPSADVGSIGVFTLHCDMSGMLEQMGAKPTIIFAGEHKVEGNQFEPLDEGAREHMQGQVNQVYRDFLKAVARGRGVPVSKVEADFGQGRTLMARDALRAGMIDRVATINAAMAEVGVSQVTLQSRRRGEVAGDNVANGWATYEKVLFDPIRDIHRLRLSESEFSPRPEPEPAAADDGAASSDAQASPNHHRRLARLRHG